MINITIAIITIAAGICSGCFIGKVCCQLEGDDVALAKLTSICSAVLTPIVASFSGFHYSAVVIGAIGLLMVSYSVPIYRWIDENWNVDEAGSYSGSGWINFAGFIGGVVGSICALVSAQCAFVWKLSMIPGAAILAILCFGTLLWLVWLFIAVILLCKKAFSAKTFNYAVDRAAELLSRCLAGSGRLD